VQDGDRHVPQIAHTVDDVTFLESHTDVGEVEPTELAGHRLALQLNGPVRMESWQGGRYVEIEKRPGTFALIPAGTTVGFRWSSNHHILIATLAPRLVSGVIEEVAGGRDVRLIERHGCDDPHARHLLFALRADLEAGRPSGRLYTDTLVRALTARLLAGYTVDRADERAAGALTRVRDYIEANLAENPSLSDLAAVAGMSPYHFARTFACTVGTPPHRYLLGRRLERAKGLLSASNRPIVEIALDLGFDSQGHFHRIFRRYVGTTPGAYRKGG
jgi:AraC family transcriptional regulator